ncbi:putative bifunctional diguanylate cyclase/phosphodiesterase [Lichenicola sp.]|uniref:putative bifunctional diguanylate cyclase/phosphodiesterase n=1 Tax=Lichenicola sp. TaxID=2804529 RepID=UPI003B000B19
MANKLGDLRALFSVHAGDPDLASSQFQALSRQLPLLYCILMANAVALCITHVRSSPFALAVIVPMVLCGCCSARAIFWSRAIGKPISSQEAVRQLRRTGLMTPLFGVAFTAWSLSLYPYGDTAAKFHVAFYMSITVISCIFCLMHLRAAALLLTAVVVVPFSIFFCCTGRLVFVAVAINLLLVTCGLIYVLLRNYRDFAELIVSQRELRRRHAEAERLGEDNFRLANLDDLTGLPNRRRFLSDLEAVMETSRLSEKRCVLALIDLDNFKSVNDIYGHVSGDRLLTEVAGRLKAIGSPSVFLARLGGDEFGVIFADNPTDDDLASHAGELGRVLQGPYLMPDIAANVSGSIGMVAFPDGGDTAGQLFERADFALYRAKETRTGQAVVFSQAHESLIRERHRLVQALRHADFEREMWLAFQPIIDTATARTTGFEALARWNSPVLGAVGPDLFIPVAEREHLIGRLTGVLLTKALIAARSWPVSLRIAINLSARDITSLETIADVSRIISESGIAPGRIDVEITETAALLDFSQATAAIEILRQLGVRIALDDFGTGCSSLGHVHRLKPDQIKIDRSFVTDVQGSKTSGDIIRTIIDLCKHLDLDCVVEGVETEAQKRVLTALGCRVMQGYLFSRPMPASAVAAFLADQQRALPALALAAGRF